MTKKQFSLKPITTKELGEFTEAVVLPGVEQIMDIKLKPLGDKVSNLETKVGNMEGRIMGKLDHIDFKISSQNEQNQKDSENMHDWVKEIDERLTSIEAKR
ncbi:MAG: hypothetical protein Q8P07_01155 [bacterium]|nr:hypothetical protein [bacterium]